MKNFAQRRTGAEPSYNLRFLCASAPLRVTNYVLIAAAITLSVFAPLLAVGQQSAPPPVGKAGDESAQFKVETIHDNLDNPAGLVVRPGAGNSGPFSLYFSESGAGRVVRLATDKPSELQPVVTGFPIRPFRRGADCRVGPLGLAFLSRMKLAVGVGNSPDDPIAVGVYNLPDEGESVEFASSVADASLGPRKNSKGNERFFNLARTEGALLLAACDDEGVGGVFKASIDANKLSGLRQLIKAPSDDSARGVLGVAINPKPRANYLLSAQMGELGAERDSRVTFLAPASGDVALQLEAGLRDATALAYSPAGDLYVADAAWDDPAAGGVYRIDAAEVDGRQSCRPVRIATIARPTSLVFTADGALYATAFGPRNDPTAPPTGALLKITPAEDAPPL